MKRIFVDLHVLQTVPPSCVNRDDTGSPKTAVYGGVTRARVSSQSWKRAVREYFKDIFPQNLLSVRTKHIIEVVEKNILALDPLEAAQELAQKLLGLVLKLKEKSDEGTGALFFISNAQAKALAELAIAEKDDLKAKKETSELKKKVHSALLRAPGIDIALFGRMVADDPTLNNDACAQVAHSLSTHKVSNEFDYFTAIDDCSPEDNAGAGHLGTVEYNSSTLYRYATVAVHDLYKQLGDDTPAALRGFVEAFVRSMPTGKQNTFANRTPVDMVYVTLREDQPLNLVGAFEKPVRASEEGYVEASKKAFVRYAQSVYADYADAPKEALGMGDALKGIATTMPLKVLLDEVEQIVRKECENA